MITTVFNTVLVAFHYSRTLKRQNSWHGALPGESLRVFALFLPVGCVARELSRGGEPVDARSYLPGVFMGGAKHLTDSRSNVERTLGHPVCIAQFSLVRSTARGLGLEAIGPAHDAHAYRSERLAEAFPIGSREPGAAICIAASSG
jgi:hypothetical protein